MARIKKLQTLHAVVRQVAFMARFVGEPSGNQVAENISPDIASRATVYRYLRWSERLGLLARSREHGAHWWTVTARGSEFLDRWHELPVVVRGAQEGAAS